MDAESFLKALNEGKVLVNEENAQICKQNGVIWLVSQGVKVSSIDKEPEIFHSGNIGFDGFNINPYYFKVME